MDKIKTKPNQDTGFDVLPTILNLTNRLGTKEQLKKHIEEKARKTVQQ